MLSGELVMETSAGPRMAGRRQCSNHVSTVDIVKRFATLRVSAIRLEEGTKHHINEDTTEGRGVGEAGLSIAAQERDMCTL